MDTSLIRVAFNQFIRIAYKAFFVILAILVLDQATKFLVYQYIPHTESGYYYYPYGGIGIFRNFYGIEFSINHMTNKGAAWGILGEYQFPLIIIRLFLIVGTLIYLFFFNKRRSWEIPLLLIAGGAIGNVIDFFLLRTCCRYVPFCFMGI